MWTLQETWPPPESMLWTAKFSTPPIRKITTSNKQPHRTHTTGRSNQPTYRVNYNTGELQHVRLRRINRNTAKFLLDTGLGVNLIKEHCITTTTTLTKPQTILLDNDRHDLDRITQPFQQKSHLPCDTFRLSFDRRRGYWTSFPRTILMPN